MEKGCNSETEMLVAHLFRHQAGRLTATLTRMLGSRYLDLAEDAVQDALITALQQWPFKGIPENPAGWLTLTAKNRAFDRLRREANLAGKLAELERVWPQHMAAELPSNAKLDDQLALIFMCCHPAISREAQAALTLKTVCGFSTAEIARAFLTQDSAIAQRLVRAKRQIREQDISIELPDAKHLAQRLDAVLRVLYLLFNEGYGATRGDNLTRADLCEEAVRLGTLLTQHASTRCPAVHALLALLMLQAARLPVRLKADGLPALLAEQDRTLWDQRLIAGGLRHLAQAAAGTELTAYHLQAEIAAIHAVAVSETKTDWQRLTHLYDELLVLEPTPIVTLNRAIALARWQGPLAGIRTLEAIETHPLLQGYYLLPATLAELWRQAGDTRRAAEYYRTALVCLCTTPERKFLETRLQLLEQATIT
jgi:RNA polymerase sigma-70 factor, ECF subfamily